MLPRIALTRELKNYDWRNVFTGDEFFLCHNVFNEIQLSLYVCVHVEGEGVCREVIGWNNAHSEIEGVWQWDNTLKSTMTALTRGPNL